MKYWFKNVADNIYIYPKSAPRNLILQIRTSDCNSAWTFWILPIIIISRFLINPVDYYGFGGPYSKKVFRLYVY